MARTPEGFRTLHFSQPADALAEARRLANLDAAGQLRRAGQWSLGQALGHLATWIDFGYEGYPPSLQPPWGARMLVRMIRPLVIRRRMPPGLRFRDVPGGTYGIEDLSVDTGLRRFTRALNRLEAGPPPISSPLFGRLSQDDAITLHMRHAEGHLGHFSALQSGYREQQS